MASMPLCVLCITWVFVTMTSSISASTLHYDSDQLTLYVRLAQQLRHTISKDLEELDTAITNMDIVLSQSNADLDAMKIDAYALFGNPKDRIMNLTSYMKLNFAPVLNVWGSATYASINDPILTDVKINHGFGFDAAKSEATVPIDGLYMVEIRIQAEDYKYFSVDFTINRPDGVLLHFSNHQWLYGCIPSLEMFALEAGSVMRFGHMKPWSSYYTASVDKITPGMPTQVTIRYFGPKD